MGAQGSVGGRRGERKGEEGKGEGEKTWREGEVWEGGECGGGRRGKRKTARMADGMNGEIG